MLTRETVACKRRKQREKDGATGARFVTARRETNANSLRRDVELEKTSQVAAVGVREARARASATPLFMAQRLRRDPGELSCGSQKERFAPNDGPTLCADARRLVVVATV